MPTERLCQHERLPASEIRRLVFKGHRIAGRLFVLLYAKRPSPDEITVLFTNRIGIIVKKRAEKHAHDRNRIKRLCREAYRRHKDIFPEPFDYGFLVDTHHDDVTYDSILQEMKTLAAKVRAT